MILISPSQIQTFDDERYPDTGCQAKWGYQKLDQLYVASTPKQEFGTNVHSQIEPWLQSGKLPDGSDAGKTAKLAIKPDFLPTPGPQLLVEHNIRIPLEGTPIVLNGFADVIVPPDLINPIPIVIDHKTTTSKLWVKTEEDLRTDAQQIIYGAAAMILFNTVQVLDRWIYYIATDTKDGRRIPKEALKREVLHDQRTPEFRTQWESIKTTSYKIADAKQSWKSGDDAPKNPKACAAYGGCPYAEGATIPMGKGVRVPSPFAGRCQLPLSSVLISHLAQFDRVHHKTKVLTDTTLQCNDTLNEPKTVETNLVTLFDSLKNGAPLPQTPTATGPAPTPTPSATGPAPVPLSPPAAPPPTPPNALEAALAASVAATAPPAKPPAAPAPQTPTPAPTPDPKAARRVELNQNFKLPQLKAQAKAYDITVGSMRKVELIDAILFHEEQAGMLGPQVAPTTPPAAPQAAPQAAVEPAPSPQPIPQPPAPQAVPESAPPTLTQTITEGATVRIDEPPTFAEMASEGPPVEPPVSHGQEIDLTLFVDCVVRKSNGQRVNGQHSHVIDLVDWVEPVAQKVAKELGAEHIGAVDYAKGGPILAARVAQMIQKQKPTAIILLDSQSIYGKALKDTLMHFAHTVIQGV